MRLGGLPPGDAGPQARIKNGASGSTVRLDELLGDGTIHGTGQFSSTARIPLSFRRPASAVGQEKETSHVLTTSYQLLALHHVSRHSLTKAECEYEYSSSPTNLFPESSISRHSSNPAVCKARDCRSLWFVS